MKCLTFKALSRPNLIYGIPREFFYLAGFCSIVVWMASNNILFGMASMLLWLPMGFMWAKVDPDFMGVYLAKYMIIKPNHTVDNKQHPEIIIPALIIITIIVTGSLTAGIMSLIVWLPLYFKYSDNSTEYQA